MRKKICQLNRTETTADFKIIAKGVLVFRKKKAKGVLVFRKKKAKGVLLD